MTAPGTWLISNYVPAADMLQKLSAALRQQMFDIWDAHMFRRTYCRGCANCN